MASLPDLGMNGLVNSVRKLTGVINPGYRDVASTADFIAGCVASLVADGTTGLPVLRTALATDTTQLIGLFYCHKTLSFYKPVVGESKTFSTSPNTTTILYLNHANVQADSVYITSGGVAVSTSDYTLTATNGVITADSPTTGTWLISYLYEDSSLIGIDQTLGSGKAATLEGDCEVATLVYDTSKAYTLNGNLYSTSTGYVTSTYGGGSVVGRCTKTPTATDPELHFKLKI